MSIKARIIYVIFFIALNAIGNTIGSAFIAFIALALPWLVIIPALSRVTKFDLLHNKITEKFGGDNIVNIKEAPKQTKSNDSISEDIHAETVTEQTSAEETAKNQTVKDLIISAVDGALKEFIANPPDEAYETTSGYFRWYLAVRDSDYFSLFSDIFSEENRDEICVNCNIGLLEEVIMNQTGNFSEVESDVKTAFETYLNQSDEQNLQKDSSIIDLTKSHIGIVVFEVHDGVDVWRYREQHSFLNLVDSGMSGRDKALLIAATDPNGFRKLEDKFKNDKEIAMVAIEKSPDSFYDVSDNLKNDKEVAMAAVTGNGYNLDSVSDNLKNDKVIVMAAVKDLGKTLEYASDQLKNDKEIVMAAVKDYEGAIEHASDSLKSDKDILELIKASN